MRVITELLPQGEVRVSEYPENSILADNVYLWEAGKGWRQWINSDTVEGGGYWRAVSNESQMQVLDIRMQQAIAAQVVRNPDRATQENSDE